MITKEVTALGIPAQPISELYKEIELTEEERNAAIEKGLFEARYAKAAAMNREAYSQKLRQERIVSRYTAQKLYDFLSMTVGFIIDQDNENIVRLLCEYFADDAEFEKKGFSLDKGLLLFGGVGVGKTHLLSVFRQNQKQSYLMAACQDVESSYAKNGDDKNPNSGEPGLSQYFVNRPLSVQNQWGQISQGFLFDDLGQENTNTKYYGTERNTMVEVLSQRYKNRLFTGTHITTNLSAVQIKEVYGVRVADRMREMFNLISFPETAKSRRK